MKISNLCKFKISFRGNLLKFAFEIYRILEITFFNRLYNLVNTNNKDYKDLILFIFD